MTLRILSIQFMAIIIFIWGNRNFSYLFSYKTPKIINIIQFPKANEDLEYVKDKHFRECFNNNT